LQEELQISGEKNDDGTWTKASVEAAIAKQGFFTRLNPLGEMTKEEKENEIILKEKKLKYEYDHFGYEEKEDLIPAKKFVKQSPHILSTIPWGPLAKNSTEYREKMLGRAEDQIKTEAKQKAAQADPLVPIGLGGEGVKKGVDGLTGSGASAPDKDSNLAVDLFKTLAPEELSENEKAQEIIRATTGDIAANIENIESVISDAFIGILSAISGILAFKDIMEGKAAVDGQNASKVASGLANLAIAGLKITSTVDDKLGTSSTLLSVVPGLGVAISFFKISENYFAMSLADASVKTMEKYKEEIKPAYYKSEVIFEKYVKKSLMFSTDLKKVKPEFLNEAQQVMDKVSLEALNSKYNTSFNTPDELPSYLDTLRTYSLMAKLQEINFTKGSHAYYKIVSHGLKLSASISALIPGGQFVAAAAILSAGSIDLTKGLAVAAKKVWKGDDKGFFGSGEYGDAKHQEYVMSVKKIIEMYSSIADDVIVNKDGKVNADITDEKKANNTNAEQRIPILENLITATGAYPPAVYKEAEKDPEGYKSVDKLVSSMKKR